MTERPWLTAEAENAGRAVVIDRPSLTADGLASVWSLLRARRPSLTGEAETQDALW